LNPAPEDTRFVERLLPRGGRVVRAALPAEQSAAGGSTLPRALVIVAATLALALAVYLVLTERLRWRTA